MKKVFQGICFAAILAFTIGYVLKHASLSEITSAIGQSAPVCLVAAVLVMGVYFLGEGLNITRGLKLNGYEVTMGQGIKYAVTGFFFSSVTPSASGGQPMQLFQMHRDGISAGTGTLVLLLEFVSYQTITVVMAVCGLLIQWDNILLAMNGKLPLLMAGFMINLVTMVFVYILLFSPRLVDYLRRWAWIEHHFGQVMTEYQKGAVWIKCHKQLILPYYLTTMMQMLAMYSVPYLVYLSFGLETFHWLEVVSLQAVLYVSVSALPIPGAMGVSESGFSKLFRILFPAELLGGAMVLSRGISFYLYVLISGCICAWMICSNRNLLIEKPAG